MLLSGSIKNLKDSGLANGLHLIEIFYARNHLYMKRMHESTSLVLLIGFVCWVLALIQFIIYLHITTIYSTDIQSIDNPINLHISDGRR